MDYKRGNLSLVKGIGYFYEHATYRVLNGRYKLLCEFNPPCFVADFL